MNIIPSQFDLLQRSLDLASMNQQAVSQNMANVNTPGYDAVEVQYAGGAESLVQATSGGGDKPFVIVPTGDPRMRNDRNNVDLDREIGKLNKATLLFRTYSQLLSTRLSQMRSAIRVG